MARDCKINRLITRIAKNVNDTNWFSPIIENNIFDLLLESKI
jgi:hypothetical protein